MCQIDLHSGAWRLVLRCPDRKVMGMRGVYQEITPPERLVSPLICPPDPPRMTSDEPIPKTQDGGLRRLLLTRPSWLMVGWLTQ
ncbi:MAG: hypothetical protein ACRD0K_25475 [Egibacteraceae bacterium]